MSNIIVAMLSVVMFYDALVMLLLPSSVQFILGTDGSAARFIVEFMGLAVAGWMMVHGGLRPLKNKWMAVFILLVVVSHFHSPNINFESYFLPKDMAIYNYKPMFELLVFFLMFLGVSNLSLSSDDVKRINKSFCWMAVIYSGYIILQRLGIDQWYTVVGEQVHLTRHAEAGGFISQPVFAGAFLALCFPFAIKNKKHWMTALIFVGAFLTGNRSCIFAMVVCALLMNRYWMRVGKLMVIAYCLMLVAALAVFWNWEQMTVYFNESGRLPNWKNLLLDFIHPNFPGLHDHHYIITGHGIGAFPVIFPFYHHSDFFQAHNEFLEILYGTGLAGITITFLMIKDFFKQVSVEPVRIGLFAIGICALTNPVLHIPQLAFITTFLLGMLYNPGVAYVLETRTPRIS